MTEPVRLYNLPDFPNQIVITKADGFVEGGAFFLDFSRPLKHTRWLGMQNPWAGPSLAIFVPVVHQGEARGGYVVGVDRTDPYFSDLRALWKQRYPQKRQVPAKEIDGLTLITNFATQFPEDSR